jgi:oxygen-dependent protoporphyrinogen oxidase
VRQVGIIGGGLAGLTCAYALKRRGIESRVFEAADKPGGRDAAAPFLLSPDLFQNTFKLLDELGLANDILEISPHAGQVYKGRVYHHRVASATGLLSFRGLNIADKILLPRMAYLLGRYGSRIDFHHPEKGLEFDDESVAAFVKRELSQNVLNYVAGPLISTLFFYGSEETSNWLYLVLAKHMYNTRMSTLRGGIRGLGNQLGERLQVVRNHSVRSVAPDGDGYLIDGNRFSDVVVAVPGVAVLGIHGLAELLTVEDKNFFEDCEYQRVVSVRVGTKEPLDGHCYAVSIPRVEKLRATTVSFHDYIDPDDCGLLTISGGGPEVTPAELLEDLFKLYSVKPESVENEEWTYGMPKFPPGRYREIVAFQSRERRPSLFFCGDYLSGPLIEGGITSGLRAAELCFRNDK